ncbi:MAG: arsenate reductase [Acidobacteriota bacterium]|jgi:arsenate reductase
MATKSVTIYHNPNCGTSRNVLALLKEQGIEPVVIQYLKHPPSKADWKALVQRSGLSVRNLLRTKEKLYTELNLADPKWTDSQLLDVLAEHPVLLNRPVVETAKGVRPCRPAETVLELLD